MSNTRTNLSLERLAKLDLPGIIAGRNEDELVNMAVNLVHAIEILDARTQITAQNEKAKKKEFTPCANSTRSGEGHNDATGEKSGGGGNVVIQGEKDTYKVKAGSGANDTADYLEKKIILDDSVSDVLELEYNAGANPNDNSSNGYLLVKLKSGLADGVLAIEDGVLIIKQTTTCPYGQ